MLIAIAQHIRSFDYDWQGLLHRQFFACLPKIQLIYFLPISDVRSANAAPCVPKLWCSMMPAVGTCVETPTYQPIKDKQLGVCSGKTACLAADQIC